MTDSDSIVQRHHTTRANGIAMHYVEAGAGDPLVLLHGFSQTWYMWSKDIIPALARDYHVIAPDLRGAGDSEKPPSGYDKRTMAEDIHALVTGLGHTRVKILAHDFGAAVAYAYAATYRDEVEKLAVFEILIPGFGYEDTLVYPFPEDGLGRKVWHMAFHNAPYGIPEFLISGRERKYLDYFWSHFAYNPSAVTEDERQEYARCYSTPGGLHALKYYRTHAEDAAYNTEAAQTPLEIPVLAYGGDAFIGEGVKASLEQVASNVQGGVIPQCGHWVTAEQPQFVIDKVREFFADAPQDPRVAVAQGDFA
jgi:pimeloyl-ACP methyl ester carboxylesterase